MKQNGNKKNKNTPLEEENIKNEEVASEVKEEENLPDEAKEKEEALESPETKDELKDETLTKENNEETKEELVAENKHEETPLEKKSLLEKIKGLFKKKDKEPKPKLTFKERLARRKERFFSVNKDNDIKYSGPLSYRYLRIVGWLLFALAQVGVVLSSAGKINAGFEANTRVVVTIFSICGTFMMPLFMIAAFSIILRERNSYKRLLILYGGLTIAMIGGYFLIYEHYIVGLASVIFEPAEAREFTSDFLEAITLGHPFAFNIFIDLFLCVLFSFFLNYRPKHLKFLKKHVWVFRLLCLIPILYEAASLTLKSLASNGVLSLPHFTYPLFTTKPPLMFVLFIILVLYIKYRERIYLKRGFTHEQYTEFLKTKYNSFQFARSLSILIAIFAVLDLIIFVIGVAAMSASIQPTDELPMTLIIQINAERMNDLGFGLTTPMLLISPLLLLFDINKKHNNDLADLLIPIAGIIVIVFIYFEGYFQIITHLPQLTQ